jgi:folate-binding protein YgfZ
LYLVDAEGQLYLSVAPGIAAEVAETLNRFLVMEDAELAERSPEYQWSLLYGREAFTKARTLAAAFGGNSGRLLPWSDVAVLVVPRERMPELVAELDAHGVQPASSELARVLRLERNLFEFGVDFTNAANPHEAALERRAVSWSKGCYLGQEVVCMQDMRGKVKRRLVSLELESGPAPAPGSAVLSGEEPVGEVTSAASAGRVLAAARLKSPHFEQPGPLLVSGIAARIVEWSASG